MHIILKIDSQLEKEVLNLLDFDTSALKNLEAKGYDPEDIRRVVKDFDIRWETILERGGSQFVLGKSSM